MGGIRDEGEELGAEVFKAEKAKKTCNTSRPGDWIHTPGGGAAPPGSLHNLHGSERRQALQGSLTFSINSQLPKQQKNMATGAAAKQEEASRKKKGGERRKTRR